MYVCIYIYVYIKIKKHWDPKQVDIRGGYGPTYDYCEVFPGVHEQPKDIIMEYAPGLEKNILMING